MSDDTDLKRAREDANKIISRVIAEIDPHRAVLNHCRRIEDNLLCGETLLYLPDYTAIHMLAVGKAACPMAAALEDLLGNRLKSGIATTKYGHASKLRAVSVREAAHPVPDSNGIEAALEALGTARSLTSDNLLIVLLSGGGSALWCAPAEGISLEEKSSTTSTLLNCGANIREINTVRKHISAIKGGRIAEAAHPARVITLALSDVIGDELTSIASGPTVPDPTTFAQSLEVVRKYGIEGKVPPKVMTRLTSGNEGRIDDTPKPGDHAFERDNQIIVGSNDIAKSAAFSLAHELGYNAHLINKPVLGEAREAARMLCDLAVSVRHGNGPVRPPALIIAGGETTVTIRGSGDGGRNQEVVLAAVPVLAKLPKTVFVSFGTDGTDGPTDAAGAIADSASAELASIKNLNPEIYLANNDSYNFFSALDDLIVTGPTQSNVMDIQLVFVL
jgi:glycerate 2-kinase